MSRDLVLKQTIERLRKLNDNGLQRVADYTEFILAKIENQLLTEAIQKLASQSKTYSFLESEEDLYTLNDIKENTREER